MRKFITQLIFHSYSYLINRKIISHYDAIRARNKSGKMICEKDLKGYLSYWEISNLNQAKPCDKVSLHEFIGKVNPKKIASFIYTGGSYGQPFKLPYSGNRTAVKTASFKFFNELAGFKIGDPFLLIAAKESPHWKQWLRNEFRFVPKDLSEAKLKELVDRINRNKIKIVIGFPSVVYQLALFCKNNQLKLPIKSVIFTSEPSEKSKRELIHQTFGCKILDRYSNEEVGLIGQQETPEGPYFTNFYNVFVEVLDDQNQPVRTGEIGRVVVTDIYSDLVPMIRYETGDLAEAGIYRDGRLITIAKIQGRVTEQILNTSGEPVAALALSPIIHKNLSENGFYSPYQFNQEDSGHFQLLIQAGEDINPEIVELIITQLKNILGKNAVIDVFFPVEIPALPSGKRPIFRNNWSRKKSLLTTN
jgi:phenylacetate-CoA ligase